MSRSCHHCDEFSRASLLRRGAAEAGRGLQMICAFSDLWGYTTPGDAGKVVWAMFTARHAPPSPARYPGRPGRDPVPGTPR